MSDRGTPDHLYADQEALKARLREFWRRQGGPPAALKANEDVVAGEIARAIVEALKPIVERLDRVEQRAGKSAGKATAGRDAFGRRIDDDPPAERDGAGRSVPPTTEPGRDGYGRTR